MTSSSVTPALVRPRASLLRVALSLLLPLPAAFAPAVAHATCWCVRPPDQFLHWSGQLNLVVRQDGLVRLVPNIRIAGSADDFALIVPTPALPSLAPVQGDVWTEASDLTRPATRRSANTLDCGTTSSPDFGTVDTRPVDSSVTIHSQEAVGAFEATIVSSTDPIALVTWLNDNGYLTDASQEAAFTPLVDDGWFFTAMKLLPGTPVPLNGWDTSVDPVEFTFRADVFEVPLDVLAINVAPTSTITVYAVDDHRMDLPGFLTTYSNRLSASEMDAIAGSHPTLARYLGAGRTLTRMARAFRSDQLAGRIRLERAATDDETRTVLRTGTVPGDVLLLALLLGVLAWKGARGRRRSTATAAA